LQGRACQIDTDDRPTEHRAMCNLYRMTKAPAEIARLFGARAGEGANFAAEVYPGYPGLVVAEREVRVMTWGFPLVLKGKSGQPLKPKPVNNAREDKLGTAFWRASFERRRCLIPVTAWAEAEGAKGAMTRTWYSLAGEEDIRCRRGLASDRGMGSGLFDGDGRWLPADGRGSRPHAGRAGADRLGAMAGGHTG
jgi:hypothetical protein